MSKALASKSTMPPSGRFPVAISAADTAVTPRPVRVRTLGETAARRNAITTRLAAALTHSCSLLVNTGRHHTDVSAFARFSVDIEDRADHSLPVETLGSDNCFFSHLFA